MVCRYSRPRHTLPCREVSIAIIQYIATIVQYDRSVDLCLCCTAFQSSPLASPCSHCLLCTPRPFSSRGYIFDVRFIIEM